MQEKESVGMEKSRVIENKLQAFVRKYYLNKLLKGVILFLATGLLYFLFVVSLEYFLWLNGSLRKLVFGLFVLVEVLLFSFFIIVPVAKLLKFSKGLSDEDASEIIGDHFPEVGDKLLNLLELKNNKEKTDLLLAGISQKVKELKSVPFTSAVDFNSSLRYIKYAAFPFLIILVVLFTGNSRLFADGYTRLANYDIAYQPPAPFSFFLENEDLQVLENENFKLKVRAHGNVVPKEASINFDDQKFFLKAVSPGVFEYEFRRPRKDIEFNIKSNGVTSPSYKLEVIKVPELLDLKMVLDYPDYTRINNEVVSGNGNARVPEGTNVQWVFATRETETVKIAWEAETRKLNSTNSEFSFSRDIQKDFEYRISTSNKRVKDFEELDYEISVIEDEYPEISVLQKIDSVDNKTRYFNGRISDDYAVNKLELVFYKEDEPEELEKIDIAVNKESFVEFLYVFPGDLSLEKGYNYQLYFQVYDNDGVTGSKSSRSEVFSYREKSLEEVEEENLEHQGESIDNLGKSLEELQMSREELNEISKLHKENRDFNYSERKKMNNFMDRQRRQTEMMRNYSEELKKSFDEENEDLNDNEYQEELRDRLERNEKRLLENEKLLEEIKKYSDKINQEELGDKLEDLSKRNQAEERNLEQLLELTKQYYMEEKFQKLSRDLNDLAKDQNKISEDPENNNSDAQEKLSGEFEEFREEMDRLEKENEELQNPLKLKRNRVDEKSIKKDQDDAEEKLENNDHKSAGEKQKDAAKKMEEMSKRMQQQMAIQTGEQLNADIESMRQILDNLVIFSFEQEELLMRFSESKEDSPLYAQFLRKQSRLRDHYRHIDDSLYSLALKNPMINEEITEHLTDIEFDMEKAIERLAENEVPQGTASQQYVVTGANNLAYLLSNILSSMQQKANPKSGKGEGNGEEFQLPDLIEQQEKLEGQMRESIGKSEQGERSKGEKESGNSEDESGELYEIYKKQNRLRRELENMLRENGNDGNAENLRDNMKRLEEDLLEEGFDSRNLDKMRSLKHELMKFQDARIEQGKDNKRRSKTSEKEFENTVEDGNMKAKEYFNSTEILNRQILPLRQIYKQKVKEYFEGGDD